MLLKLSRTQRKFKAPQKSTSAYKKALTDQQCKQSTVLNFNLLKFPVFWIAFFYDTAVYAAPKATLSPTITTPQIEGNSSKQTAANLAADSQTHLHTPAVETIDLPADVTAYRSDADISSGLSTHLSDEEPLTEARLLLSPVANPSATEYLTEHLMDSAASQVAPPETISQLNIDSPSGEDSNFLEAENLETDLSETPDPELGILRLREQKLEQTPFAEPDLSAETSDSELGILRLREQELEQIEPQDDSSETVFFIGRLSYFKSDNILLDRLDPVDDQLLSLGATLLAAPSLGPNTLLITSVEGSLIHYSQLSELDYRELEFRASIRQFLSARTYGEIGWSNQQLFNDGDRFFNDHSLRLTLARRDPLIPDLRLDSFYQLRLSFAEPGDRSRIVNTLGVALNYNIQPNLQAALDYQLTLTDFTQQDREDTYSQLVAQLSYDLSRNSRVILFGGFSFGGSSDSDVDFNSSIFGASIDVNVSLF